MWEGRHKELKFKAPVNRPWLANLLVYLHKYLQDSILFGAFCVSVSLLGITNAKMEGKQHFCSEKAERGYMQECVIPRTVVVFWTEKSVMLRRNYRLVPKGGLLLKEWVKVTEEKEYRKERALPKE